MIIFMKQEHKDYQTFNCETQGSCPFFDTLKRFQKSFIDDIFVKNDSFYWTETKENLKVGV